ncbi:hypothetical protein B6K86_02920 [Lachnospiraceae bacterium]|nr:hypothetical protein B6K86_02920 [Lachnospiraceae bacterium]
MLKTTYGTGGFMYMNTGDKLVRSENGLNSAIAWGLNKGKLTYALDADIYIADAAIQWLRDGLRVIEHAADTEQMAVSCGDTGGVYFVPAFVGLAAPHWDPYARGTIVGITRGTTKEQLVRATLESIAFQVRDNFDVMVKDSGMQVKVMRGDGGCSVNDFLMQFQSDILDVPVEVPVIKDTTALGAAYLAAYGINESSDNPVDRSFYHESNARSP